MLRPAVRARGPQRALKLHACGVTYGAGKLGGMGRGKKYSRIPLVYLISQGRKGRRPVRVV